MDAKTISLLCHQYSASHRRDGIVSTWMDLGSAGVACPAKCEWRAGRFMVLVVIDNESAPEVLRGSTPTAS